MQMYSPFNDPLGNKWTTADDVDIRNCQRFQESEKMAFFRFEDINGNTIYHFGDVEYCALNKSLKDEIMNLCEDFHGNVYVKIRYAGQKYTDRNLYVLH